METNWVVRDSPFVAFPQEPVNAILGESPEASVAFALDVGAEIIFYFGIFPERRTNFMDTNTLVRVVAGVLIVVIAAIIISRRKKAV